MWTLLSHRERESGAFSFSTVWHFSSSTHRNRWRSNLLYSDVVGAVILMNCAFEIKWSIAFDVK